MQVIIGDATGTAGVGGTATGVPPMAASLYDMRGGSGAFGLIIGTSHRSRGS
jgi:hypothetical protein